MLYLLYMLLDATFCRMITSPITFREGTLKVGDRILAANSVDVTRMSLVDVTSLLRRSKSHVHLLVEYDVSVMGE